MRPVLCWHVGFGSRVTQGASTTPVGAVPDVAGVEGGGDLQAEPLEDELEPVREREVGERGGRERGGGERGGR